MSGFIYEKDSDNVVRITMDFTGPEKTVTEKFIKQYKNTVERLERDKDDITGVILSSAEKNIFSGGSLNGLVRQKIEDVEYTFKLLEETKACMRRFEMLGKPVVATINGTSMGFGLELYLACHHRIAVNDTNIKLGFPEVSLDLLPGAGGVVRTIRLLGFEKGLPLLIQGLLMNPEKALAEGFLDDLAEDKNAMTLKAKTWIQANPQALQPWDMEGYKIPGGGVKHPNVKQLLLMMPGILKKRTRGLLPAPEIILAAAAESLRVDFETALRIESRKFVGLATNPGAKA